MARRRRIRTRRRRVQEHRLQRAQCIQFALALATFGDVLLEPGALAVLDASIGKPRQQALRFAMTAIFEWQDPTVHSACSPRCVSSDFIFLRA